MRFKEIISEAPLPGDWDKEVYTPQTSFKKRMEYAIARAQKMGRGSSRTAFIIEYQGRPTILKVAHNRKGMAQNEAEARILSDRYVSNIVIPIIDYDEDHDYPTWIHTEKAEKATEKQLCQLLKTPSLMDLVTYARYNINGDSTTRFDAYIRKTISDNDMQIFYEHVDAITELYTNFNVNVADFAWKQNWGIFNGRPVVIDVGYTEEVIKQHY
jgi:hypothetical protein